MFGSHFNLDIFGFVSLVIVYQRKYLVCQWSVDYHMCAYQDDNNNQDRMQRLKQETHRKCNCSRNVSNNFMTIDTIVFWNELDIFDESTQKKHTVQRNYNKVQEKKKKTATNLLNCGKSEKIKRNEIHIR